MPEQATDSATDSHDSADSGALEHPLLEVQRWDTEIEQLRRRRDSLPLRGELGAAQARHEELRRELGEVSVQRLEVLNRQKRLEDEAAILEAKADKNDTRLHSGEVSGLRDLQALQEEVAALRSRQGTLEEAAIAALLEAEDLTSRTERLDDEREACEERVTVLQAEVRVSEAEIDEQIAVVASRRSQARARTDRAALAKYESLRDTFGPSTAVAFDTVSGCDCPQQMPTAEVARIKRCEPGAVLDCSECARLVLR